MKKIDLHMHSKCSDDGEFSPKELLCLGKQAQLDYMAITDHNTVRGIAEALDVAEQLGIEAISGVELDCVYEGRNFHLLGYGFDYTQPIFTEIEENILVLEKAVAEEKINLIKKATNISLSTNEVLAKAVNGIVTGELIAEILLEQEDATKHVILEPYLAGGARSDNPYVNFYWDFFAQGKPAYVPIQFMSLQEAVELLHKTGGIAVLAHPGQNLQGDDTFLEKMLESGIDGIEAYSSYHDRIEAGRYHSIAKEHNLLVTCGSDFHGKTKPSISLGGHRGEEMMQSMIEVLKDRGVLKR